MEHHCIVLDIFQITDNDYKVTCSDCGKVRYWNALTNQFYDKIYPKGDQATFNPITTLEMQ